MIETKSTLRVRYAETDKMGVVYHANYAIYFEMARTEMFRQIGLPYTQMEADGIMLPLVDLHINYKRPAHYDDLLTVVTQLREMPGVRIRFDYSIFNQEDQLLVDGYTTLAFIDTMRNRPTRIPENVRAGLSRFFENDTKH